MISFFRKKADKSQQAETPQALTVDMHSHILPGLDDGAETIEKSMVLIQSLVDCGYQKLIATPHIMGDFYKNTPVTINAALATLRDEVQRRKIPVIIEAAAEYYLDEWFLEKLNRGETLMSFGSSLEGIRYLLFEISYINQPSQLKEAIFLIKTCGYRPVLAHPERYLYLYNDFNKLKELHENGVLFQINANSLSGYYSKTAQLLAEKLIDNRMVNFIGTDCHAQRHLDVLMQARKQKYYRKALELNVLNNSLNL